MKRFRCTRDKLGMSSIIEPYNKKDSTAVMRHARAADAPLSTVYSTNAICTHRFHPMYSGVTGVHVMRCWKERPKAHNNQHLRSHAFSCRPSQSAVERLLFSRVTKENMNTFFTLKKVPKTSHIFECMFGRSPHCGVI